MYCWACSCHHWHHYQVYGIILCSIIIQTSRGDSFSQETLIRSWSDEKLSTCFQPPFCVQNIRNVVSSRLKDHKDRPKLHEPFQSAYRKHHSTETALLRVQNDILRSVDNGYCVFLVLLDLSAAFDTVSHAVLLHRLQQRNGISNSAHQWIVSYLNGRSQRVQISGTMSCKCLSNSPWNVGFHKDQC